MEAPPPSGHSPAPGPAARVAVIGGGLAGPCLAHGLLRSGFAVELYERDGAAGSRDQGYRIHIAPEGTAALRACLPPERFELVLAINGRPARAITTLRGDLTELHAMPAGAGDPGGDRHLSVDRLTLRQVLLHGLDRACRFGAEFTHYEPLADGTVRAHFADGSATEADLLVGADGPLSRVRRQLLPGARVRPTGQVAVFGKTPLDGPIEATVPPAALHGFSVVVGEQGRFMALGAHRFATDPRAAAERLCPGLVFGDTRDYVMWALSLPTPAFEEAAGTGAREATRLPGSALRDLAAGRIRDWHADLVRLVAAGDPGTVRAQVLRTAVAVGPWPPGPVTLIGDAIHCMVPAGIGAAVALRDAGLLAERLGAARAAGTSLVEAIGGYENQMREYGFAAVAASQAIARQFSQ